MVQLYQHSDKRVIVDMKTSDDGIFTVPELARYLRMKPITIYKHVAQGKLPGFKVGSKWRFKKETIDLWIKRQEESNFKLKES